MKNNKLNKEELIIHPKKMYLTILLLSAGLITTSISSTVSARNNENDTNKQSNVVDKPQNNSSQIATLLSTLPLNNNSTVNKVNEKTDISKLNKSAVTTSTTVTTATTGAVAKPVIPPTLFTGSTIERIMKTNTIYVGNRASSSPFSYFTSFAKNDNPNAPLEGAVGASPMGYSVDICDRLVDRIKIKLNLPQLKVERRTIGSADRINSLKEGRIDIECGSTTNNVTRREEVDFSIPYFVAGLKFLVKKDGEKYNTIDSKSPPFDLTYIRDKKIVTTIGTTAEKVLLSKTKERLISYQPVTAKSNAEALEKLEKGEVFAFATDDILLAGARASSVQKENLFVVGDPLSAEPYSVMLRKNDTEFKKLIDKELISMINGGELKLLYNKWFLSPIPPKNEILKVDMSPLLIDIFRMPTDKVGD